MKRCWDCGEYKPLNDYHRDKRRGDGHTGQCKVCVSRYHSERFARLYGNDPAFTKKVKDNAKAASERFRRLREVHPDALKLCRECAQKKPLKVFYSRASVCNECLNRAEREKRAVARQERERQKAEITEKTCSKCEITKSLEAFRERTCKPNPKPFRVSVCLDCERASLLRRYYENKERYREIQQAYYSRKRTQQTQQGVRQ